MTWYYNSNKRAKPRREVRTMKKSSKHNKMKRRAKRQATIIVLMLVLLLSLVSYIESHYKRVATVDSVDNNVVSFVDTLGYTWEATDVENVVEGQKVLLKMYTNHTNNIITDDIIVGIKPTAIRMK